MLPGDFDFSDNPLHDDSPDNWDRLVQALRPSRMLVCIETRLGPKLRASVVAEDVWQEALVQVWRQRSSVEWRGLASFRRWVLSVVEHCITDLADRLGARKRGGDWRGHSLEKDEAENLPPMVSSTTPSRVASFVEEARVLSETLAELPDEVRDVVRLRLFEDVEVRDVAEQLGLGESAVKHRSRRGAELFQLRLRQKLG